MIDKTKQKQFQGSVIAIGKEITYGDNFVRVMAAMAVPPGMEIYDVSPNNGLSPMYYDVDSEKVSCLGDIILQDTSIRPLGGNQYIFGYVENTNTKVANYHNLVCGLFINGLSILGTTKVPTEKDSIEFWGLLDTIDKYDAIIHRKEGEKTRINVWAVTTADSTILDVKYYLDWSGGQKLTKIPPEEYTLCDSNETVSYNGTSSQICEWRKLANATGFRAYADTANKTNIYGVTVGIISAGQPSTKDPYKWVMNAYKVSTPIAVISIHLNVHEINHKTMGKCYLNSAQGHTRYGLIDDITTSTGEVTVGSKAFWNILGMANGDKYRGHEGGDTKIMDIAKAYGKIYASYPFETSPDAPDGLYSYMITHKIISTTYTRASSTSTAATLSPPTPIIQGVNYIITEVNEEDDGNNFQYRLWYENGTWNTDAPVATSEPIYIWDPIYSIDTKDFEYGDDTPTKTNIVPVDDVYPEYVYYYRLKFSMVDMASSIVEGVTVMTDIDIALRDGSDIYTYGTYALCNYGVDENGWQNAMPDEDNNPNKRFCGIYGRNANAVPDNIIPLSLYQTGDTKNIWYPPSPTSVLLSRAMTAVTNRVKLQQQGNSITFIMSGQTLMDVTGSNTYIDNNNVRPISSIAKNPGYCLNTTSMSEPIADVSIYSAYLSNKFAIAAAGHADIVPIMNDGKIELHVAVYARNGDDPALYASEQDINRSSSQYVDAYLVPKKGSMAIDSDFAASSNTAGWVGNMTSIVLRENRSGEASLSIAITGRQIEVSIQTGTTTWEEVKDAINADAVAYTMINVTTGTGNLAVAGIYVMSDGGVANYITMHSNGKMYQLDYTDTGGNYNVSTINGKIGNIYKYDIAELLVLKLDSIEIGKLSKADETYIIDSPAQEAIDAVNEYNAHGILSHLSFDGIEYRATATATDMSAPIFIAFDGDAPADIEKKINNGDSPMVSITDIFYPDGNTSDINEALVYSGKYQPKITIQLPRATSALANLQPYYIARLVYSPGYKEQETSSLHLTV